MLGHDVAVSRSFLDLLYDEAARSHFDELLASATAAATDEEERARLRADYDVALRLRELISRQRSREAELSALYETASDLTAIRDVDAILAAIVRRARQLLNADMTYLSLNDELDGASYMKVTDGALTPEFRRLRLPLGTGLLGLVAQTGAPYFTEDYQTDSRFVHRTYIDEAVDGERIRAILGVPLVLDGRVIGALLAVHRTVRKFPPAEVSLLTSFAAHASVALENARLFAELDTANRNLTEHTSAVESAATAHDRLTDLLLHGGGTDEIALALGDLLRGRVAVLDPSGERVAGDADLDTWREAVAESVASGHCVPTPRGYVAAATAGSEHVSTVVIEGPPLSSAEQRTLERGALVTALVVLLARTVAEAEERIGGELLRDLLSPTPYDAVLVRERARRHGAQLDGPLVVAVAGPAEGDRPATTRAAARLADTLHGVAGEHEGAVVLVVPEGDARGVGDQLAAAVTRAGAAATVGVAGPAPAAEVAVTYGEARGCLETLLTLGRVGEVTDPAGLGVARLLLGANGPGQLAEFVDRELGPVAAYDAQRGTSLVATLDAWFASGGSLKDTAAALHVHPNTVTQRLERVTGLLGETWRAPERALDLQLALRVARLQA